MKLLEQASEFLSGTAKLFLLIVSIVFSSYQFVVKSIDEKIESSSSALEMKIMAIRNKDIELLETKVNNIEISLDNGLRDIKEQNKLIMQHLLRQKQK